MAEFLFYILAGGSVGFVVGVTGVGGGSFMTPILIGMGFAPAIAVGTDLLYAAITKANGVIAHQRQQTIDWPIVFRLSSGSIPASLLTTWYLSVVTLNEATYSAIITNTLGFMLVITGIAILCRKYIDQRRKTFSQQTMQTLSHRQTKWLTCSMGVLLGIFVTISSVGAGAFGAAVLLTLYPRISTVRIIGTDLAHAVPLTAIAGLGHLHLGNVNGYLLLGLIIGSLPMIWFGTKVGYKLPEKILQPILVCILIGLGIKYLVA